MKKYEIVGVGRGDGYSYLHNILVGKTGSFKPNTTVTNHYYGSYYSGDFLLDKPLTGIDASISFYFAFVRLREVTE